MRKMRRAWRLSALVAAGLILTSGALLADGGPVVHVKAVVKGGAVQLVAQADGPFTYTTYRPSASLYVLDLSGVSAADPAGARVVPSDLVKSYRVLAYTSGEKPMVRLEVLMSKGLEPRLERTNSNELTLSVSRTQVAGSPSDVSRIRSQARMTLAASKSTVGSAPPETSESIQQVNLSQEGSQTAVNVLGSGRLNYRTIRLHNPDRLVLDFVGAHLKTAVDHIPSNLEPVREIRMGQFNPEVSRVVIDLRNSTNYNISSSGNTVTVLFAPGAPSGGAANDAPADQPASLSTTKLEAPKFSPVEHAQVKPAEIPTPAAILPAALTQNSSAFAAPASARPLQQEATDATHLAAAATAASNSAGAAPVSASPAPANVQQAPADQTNSSAAPMTMPGTSAKYTGEPISVNLKDVDLRDFFRLIHEISGLNVVVDPSVKGNLTIVLDNVPWDQALDIVLQNNDLDKQLNGNVLRIATKETVKKEAEEARDLTKAQSEAVDLVTTTRVLSYAKAADMVPTLKKFLSERGDIFADDRTNTLIIRDIPTVLPVIDNLLRQLDRRSQQVEIEARVVAANRSFSREIGTQFGFATGNLSRSNVFGGDAGVGTSPIVRNFPPEPVPPIIVGSGGGTPTNGSIPLLSNLGVAAPTSGISYAFSSTNFALDMIITAAEDRGVGKLLSKPKIITQNNEKATVKQGTKIPVQTIVNNTVSVQFVDAVLELDVTPQITAEGTIYMDVTVENDQIDQSIPRVEGIPAIDTQSAETKVTVNDGATVVIGGIIVSQQRTDVQQVPLFGSIPVLGNLFKHTTVSSTSQELLFFLTPRILPS